MKRNQELLSYKLLQSLAIKIINLFQLISEEVSIP